MLSNKPQINRVCHPTRFCYFLLFFFSKFQLLSKKSAAKFHRVKTSSSKVVATSFLYLTVDRWIAGDVPIYLKLVLKLTHPHQKNADFDRFRVIVPQSWELARIEIIANRKSTTHIPSNHRWTCTLPLSPPKGGSKRCLSFVCCK